MNGTQAVWIVGRPFFGALVRTFAPFRCYGRDRIPREGPLILCFNHFSWLDPWAIGSVIPRTMYYVAKEEVMGGPLLGRFLKVFGTLSVRRGESDREAVRLMREVVRRGDALGMFPEGTRQEREPGELKPGAAMIAIQEGAPIICGAIHGTQDWRLGNFKPVSIAFGQPIELNAYPKNSKGYRDGSVEIQRELRRLFDFLVEMHELGRPRIAIPPP